jgi:hypothetical protein
VLDFLKLIRQYRSTSVAGALVACLSWHEPALRPALLLAPCVHTSITCGPRFAVLPILAHTTTLLFCTAHALPYCPS